MPYSILYIYIYTYIFFPAWSLDKSLNIPTKTQSFQYFLDLFNSSNIELLVRSASEICFAIKSHQFIFHFTGEANNKKVATFSPAVTPGLDNAHGNHSCLS